MVLAAETLAAPRHPPGGRPARQHDHRRGVDRRRRHRQRGARRARRRGHRARADRLRGLDRLPRLRLPDDHRRGPPGHAELLQPHWRDGGAVNAIEKAQVVLEAITRLREEWRTRADLQHPYLSPPDIVPTVMHAGEWSVTYPASCAITSAVLFPPAFADADGYGSRVRAEVRGVDRARLRGRSVAGRAPAELRVGGRHPAHGDPARTTRSCETVLAASADVGEPSRLGGLDSWYDGATYTLSAGTPSVGVRPALDRRGRTRSTSTCRSTTSCAARRPSRWRPCASAGRHEHAHPARRAPRPGHAGPRPRVDARRSADRARAPPGSRPGRAREGPAAPADAHRREPVPARPADRGALRRGARAAGRDRSAAGRVRLHAALALDARRDRTSCGPTTTSGTRATPAGTARRSAASSSAPARPPRSTPAPTRSPCSSATAARRWASSAGR